MTYNFDPERWYENELAVLVQRRDAGQMDAEAFRAAEADLDRRYEKMLDRLDGTYRIPASSGDQRS